MRRPYQTCLLSPRWMCRRSRPLWNRRCHSSLMRRPSPASRPCPPLPAVALLRPWRPLLTNRYSRSRPPPAISMTTALLIRTADDLRIVTPGCIGGGPAPAQHFASASPAAQTIIHLAEEYRRRGSNVRRVGFARVTHGAMADRRISCRSSRCLAAVYQERRSPGSLKATFADAVPPDRSADLNCPRR